MKNSRTTKRRKPSAGSRIIASLREAVDWAEGKDVPVRVTTVEVPTIDVRAMRRRLGLSQAAFATKFGFQPATLRNWEQGRTRPDDPRAFYSPSSPDTIEIGYTPGRRTSIELQDEANIPNNLVARAATLAMEAMGARDAFGCASRSRFQWARGWVAARRMRLRSCGRPPRDATAGNGPAGRG